MKKKTKTLILSIVVTLILLLTITISYAVFTYQQTGENNQQLVLGDIYMHYNESNTIIDVDNMMPTNLYQANPIMQTNELNELEKCISYFSDRHLDTWTWSTALTYCQGTGTASGDTLQENVDSGMSSSTRNNLLNLGVVIQDGTSYLVNPIIETQEIESELGQCINTLSNMGITSQTEKFCLGNSEYEGSTFNELLNTNYFSESNLIELIDKNIVIKNDNNLPYFEFNITGKNTYNKENIYYEILLNHGEQPDDKTLRIDDKLLRFSLVEVNNNEETILLENRSYNDLNNKRIWVETINKNTLREVSKTYRLYMWIADEITICGGELQDGCDYYNQGDVNNWNQVFASIKVGVHGDFREKNVSQYEACFTYRELSDPGNYYVYFNEESNEYETYTLNTNEEAVQTCADYMLNEFDRSDNSIQKDGYISFCKGLDIGIWDYSMHEYFTWNFGNEDIEYLKDNGVITLVNNPEIGIEITDYDITCGRDVVVPETINDENVYSIGESAFSSKGIASIVFPNTLTNISYDAFFDNKLTELIIPNSVVYIGSYAFDRNLISTLELSNNLKLIGNWAFEKNRITNLEIPEGVNSLAKGVFHENQIENLVLPNSLVVIGDLVFADNKLPDNQAIIYKRRDDNNDMISEIDTTTIIGYGGANKNVVVPVGVENIGYKAFESNDIVSIQLPDGIKNIGGKAFSYNQLETITIGSGIEYIGFEAFKSSSDSNPNLGSITFTDKTCAEIKNIEASSTNTTKYFPWLYLQSPYYQEGYKVSIYGTDGECSY